MLSDLDATRLLCNGRRDRGEKATGNLIALEKVLGSRSLPPGVLVQKEVPDDITEVIGDQKVTLRPRTIAQLESEFGLARFAGRVSSALKNAWSFFLVPKAGLKAVMNGVYVDPKDPGTAGALTKSGHWLSCAHVFCPGGKTGQIVRNTYQNEVGKDSSCEPLLSGCAEDKLNVFDAGLATKNGASELVIAWYNSKEEITERNVPGVSAGDTVHMAGAKSGLQSGTVLWPSAWVKAPIGGQDRLFKGQILVLDLPGKTFSEGGDSGALVLNDSGFPVGLLIGRSGKDDKDRAVSVVSPLGPILDKLKITLPAKP